MPSNQYGWNASGQGNGNYQRGQGHTPQQAGYPHQHQPTNPQYQQRQQYQPQRPQQASYPQSQQPSLPLRYGVTVNFDWFKKIFATQNRRYNRKVGIMCLVMFVPLTVLCAAFVIADPAEAGTEGLGATALFAVLAILGGLLVANKGIMFGARKGENSEYFARHGMPKPAGGKFRNEQLQCSFGVSVEQYGYVEDIRFANGLRIVDKNPWMSLTGYGDDSEYGYVFAVNDGKNSSLAYNMLGINAYLRNGNETSPFLIPRQVEDANPWLVGWVSQAIAQQHANVKDKDKNRRNAAKKALSDWALPEIYFPDGRKADYNSEADSKQFSALLEQLDA